jgi:hypothetical protein
MAHRSGLHPEITIAPEWSDQEAHEQLTARYHEAKAAEEGAFLFGPKAWRHSDHVFGFIAAGAGPRLPVVHVGSLQADPTLVGQRISVKLDRLRVYDYPGRGEHIVLVQFAADHEPNGGAKESVSFSQRFRVQENQGAGIIGFPVFRGLRVAGDGVAFKVFTVNVMNTDDEQALAFMDSDSFTKGLTLLNSVNPAIAPISQLAAGLTKMLLSARRNVAVQDVYVGLDLGNTPLGARLRLGSYVAIQVPDAAAWDWSSVVLDAQSGQLVDVDSGQGLKFNYFAFSVEPFVEA